MWVLCGYLYHAQPFYAAFGFANEQPPLIGLIIVLRFIVAPYNAMFSFTVINLSRYFEFQADEFGKSLGHTERLCSALVKLFKDNLSFPIYDHVYSAWYHMHPTLLERIAALKTQHNKEE